MSRQSDYSLLDIFFMFTNAEIALCFLQREINLNATQKK